MADLKTTYKDDLLDTSVNEKRKYNMIQNADGTVSFEDVTTYSQIGDSFGAVDINATNKKVNEVNSNLSLDYSNVSSDVQDLNTFLQKALEKLFPQTKVFPFSNNWEWSQSVSLSATTLIDLISDVDITITVECAVYYYNTVYLGDYVVLTKNGANALNYLTKTQVANHGGYKYIGEISLNKNDVLTFGTTAMTKTGSSPNESKFAYIDISIA